MNSLQHPLHIATMSKQLIGIAPPEAPKTIGPYVHAMIHGDTVYSTCIIPLDPVSNHLIDGTAEDKIRQIYSNLSIVLGKAGTSLDRIIKQNIYLTDFADFEAFNKVTIEFLGDHRPARSTSQVLSLPKGASLGMDVIAALP